MNFQKICYRYTFINEIHTIKQTSKNKNNNTYIHTPYTHTHQEQHTDTKTQHKTHQNTTKRRKEDGERRERIGPEKVQKWSKW